MVIADFFSVIFPMTMMVNPNCDYFQVVTLGNVFYVFNKEYPGRYPKHNSTTCRWMAQSPTDTKIVLSCSDVDIPTSPNCRDDRLVVSQKGNPQFSDAHNYCGKGTISVVSESNSMAIGLFATRGTSNSQGGKFACTLTAIQASPGTTTTRRPTTCDCGWRNQNRIVGGVATKINEYPSMAGLINLVKRGLQCGSVVIAKRYALTAGHCLMNEQAWNLALLVGDHDLSSGVETTYAALYVLETYYVHPSFNLNTKEHDIAILKTQNVMDFSEYVAPACLPFRYTNLDFVGDFVTALGWGTIGFSEPLSDVLLAANLSIVSNSECQSKLTNDRIYPTQICTYTPGKDACQYDSGGPLLWYDWLARRYHVLGLISYGLACGSQLPAVNTKVPSYLAWVISMTSDAEYCVK